MKISVSQLHIIYGCKYSCFCMSILGALKAGQALISYRGMSQVFFSCTRIKKIINSMVLCIGHEIKRNEMHYYCRDVMFLSVLSHALKNISLSCTTNDIKVILKQQ